MIVCLCHRVDAATVRAAIGAGAVSLHELGRITRAGTDCGGCRPKLEQLIAERPHDEGGRTDDAR